MKKQDDPIINLLSIYINELSKSNIIIEKAYLFGSFANATQQRWSDIDLAIVSDNIDNSRIIEAERLIRYKYNFSNRISPVTFRNEDFNDNNLFVKQILKNGIRII